MQKVRIGFIGAGWWATSNHMPLLAAREDVEMAAVCGKDADLLAAVQEEFHFPFATEDHTALLAQGLDGVVVTSPHHLHFEHARDALLAGCHVMCEKPLTLHAHQAWELVRIAQERNLHLIVPYGWHYLPYINEAKALLDRGVVGEIEYVMCHMASPTKDLFSGSTVSPANWTPTYTEPNPMTWQEKSQGGGYAHGQITHSSGLMFWLTGLRAKAVSARARHSPDSQVDLYDAAAVVFENGALGMISGAATLPNDSKFQLDVRVFGSEGVFNLDIDRARLDVLRHDGDNIHVDVPVDAGMYNCDGPPARFVELIQGGAVNNSPGEVGARSVELIDAMLRSAAEGGTPVAV
ncbi:MAG: Gfo/Idh/MocA family oxidoreductase [Litorilinea sp.]